MVLKPRSDVNLTNIGPYTDSALQYITAAWDNSSKIPSRFIVGNGTITVANDVGYLNAPLSPEREYGFLIKVQVTSHHGEDLVTYSNLITARTPLAIGYRIAVALFILFISILTTIITCLK